MKTGKAGRGSKFAYVLGAIAFGVKDNGFTTFLMIYYNQVLGLSAFYTGLAILIALAVDALSDPYVGHLSDNWKSKWGRRHPFMYAAIFPIALTYFFLWNPPADTTQMTLFVYLVTMAVGVRLLITFFEVPNSAMIAELASEYDERTSLASQRVTVGWLGGVCIAIAAYVVFLVPTEEYAKGVLNKEGYQNFAFLAAVVMTISMLVSAIGTHKLIRFLPQAQSTTGNKQKFLRNIKILFSNTSFRSLFAAFLFSMMAFGVIITLQIYYATYFFGMTTKEISLFPVFMVLAALISMAVTPFLSKGREKKSVLKMLTLLAFLLSNLTIIARLMGWLPDNGDPLLLPILLAHILVSTAVMVAQQSLFSSMTADLVEDTERQAGHRLEGLYFATVSFSKKIVSGLGIFASGVFLSSAGETGQQMSGSIMTEVSYYYIPFVFILYAATYVFAGRYVLNREQHEANLKIVRGSQMAE
ncbi:MFS transporter [Sneathiella sp. P13V-1]|uniref:MFS transporter n=1 Tax=Sneathiella sp. P13V-1 TaxID=2697366 RepID=UPI00187B3F05|nr:MFS transporter [Sneathiella sp. P13V-1]MBE7637456.1 MFS transporter [Sneathiella sp. P13V-1]